MTRILLTRRPAQAGPLEAELREAGFDVGFLPLTAQRLPENRTELTAAIERLEQGDFTVVMLTSGNTVRSLLTAGWSGDLPEDTEAAVTGPGTARVLQELTEIIDPWMPTREASAEGILAEIPHPPEDDCQLLLPQSAQARPRLAEGLAELGWEVTTVTAYETVPLDAAQLDDPLGAAPLSTGAPGVGSSAEPEGDVLLLTSSTAAQAAARLRLPAHLRLLAIGRPTAKTMEELGLPCAGVLPEISASGVRQALAR